jgi:hypothetical protein
VRLRRSRAWHCSTAILLSKSDGCTLVRRGLSHRYHQDRRLDSRADLLVFCLRSSSARYSSLIAFWSRQTVRADQPHWSECTFRRCNRLRSRDVRRNSSRSKPSKRQREVCVRNRNGRFLLVVPPYSPPTHVPEHGCNGKARRSKITDPRGGRLAVCLLRSSQKIS